MADGTKQASIHGGLISEMKILLSLSTSRKILRFAYGCMLALVLFTVFLAFSPSSNSSSPVFSNIFSLSSINSSSIFSQQSYRSHFSSIFSYFFPNSSQISPNFAPTYSVSTPSFTIAPISVKNQTHSTVSDHQIEEIKKNHSQIKAPKPPVKQNQSTIGLPKSPIASKSAEKLAPKLLPVAKNSTQDRTEKKIAQKGVEVISNLTSSMLKKQSNGSNSADSVKESSQDLLKGLKNCDLFDGEWVRDDSYPLYKPGSCSLIDEQFNCFLNGRPDNGYHKLKWKPKGCSIPRLNGTHMLEMLRGKRLVFVGDSLNRNMWESLVCILRNSVKDQRKVYEASGKHHFRTEPSYSFVFEDYGCTVEFFVSPFLVQEWEMADKSGSKKETLRLDLVSRSADQYKTADIIVFNTGHWWTHEKTAKGKDYYQEGSHVYHDLNVLEAFRKALTSWGRWIDGNLNPKKSLVFFRGYSASHFSGGRWNSGGQCDHETEPIKNTTYLAEYPPKMTVLEKVLRNMKNHVLYLNITRLTDYRKDGHPSIYRKQNYTKEELNSPFSFQDCSHWCLPGVPDAWNELLYTELLIKQSLHKQH